jgi:tetratricopeptide (TPR) repeat protein
MRGSKPLILLLVLGLVFLTGCSKLRARDELNKGVRAYKSGDFETAIEHFQRANDLDPTLINARIYLATAYASQFVPGSPSEKNKQLGEEAIREFGKVLEADAGNITALSYIAQLYFGMAGAASEWDDTRELFGKSKEYRRRLIEVDPSNPEHYYSIGVIDWTLSFRPRMQARRDAGRRDEEPLPARVRRDLAEQNMEVVDEGIDVLQQALKLNDKYLDAIAYLNLMYREKADLVASPQEREELLQLADDTHERYQRLREQMQEAPATAGS